MTREEAKELLPIIQAFAEGKTIQVWTNDTWVDEEYPCFFEELSQFRIKPESKCKPFKTQKECWEEMHKHPDFGWVRLKINSSLYHIDMVGNNNLIVDNAYKGLKAVFQSFEFTDGTPFGIKEE